MPRQPTRQLRARRGEGQRHRRVQRRTQASGARDDGDRAAALALLERGVALGDAKSRTRLDAERTRK